MEERDEDKIRDKGEFKVGKTKERRKQGVDHHREDDGPPEHVCPKGRTFLKLWYILTVPESLSADLFWQ